MPRQMSANLTAIFNAPARYIDYALDITFPFATALHLATDELIKNSIDYDNSIEGVSEIVQSIENPINDVNITLSNKDRFFDAHFTTHFNEWQKAEAVLYRRYRNADRTLSEDVEVFRGGVNRPRLDDKNYTFLFDIVSDTKSKGLIVADRTLALICSFIFGDPTTCAYVGLHLFCNHLLKSGCTDNENTEHFGGMESRYTNKTSAPGSAGNPSTGDTFPDRGSDNCPALDQYVLVLSKNGETFAKAVHLIRENDFLLNPLTLDFERVKYAQTVAVNMYEVVCKNGARSKASESHPLLTNEAGSTMHIGKQKVGNKVLTWNKGNLEVSEIVEIVPKGRDIAMRIETFGPTHIYASGADTESMIVCHNSQIIKNQY